MNCAKCGQPMLEKQILCRFCIERVNEEALRKRQHQPLLLVAAGQGEFVLHPTNTGLHIEMFGYKTSKHPRAFCGSAKRAAAKDRRLAAYRGRSWETACEKCRDAVEELLGEARDADEAEAIREEA